MRERAMVFSDLIQHTPRPFWLDYTHTYLIIPYQSHHAPVPYSLFLIPKFQSPTLQKLAVRCITFIQN